VAEGAEVREVVIGTNPDIEGDGTALHLVKALAGRGVTVTRIAKGIPTGSSIEYASSAVLTDAISGRRPID
jgi:recombination protein RecR